MKIAKLIALSGLMVTTTILVCGFTVGNFAEEGKRLLSMPWGIVLLIDPYVGSALFSGWIEHWEASVSKSIVWVILMMVLGSWEGCLYTLVAPNGHLSGWQPDPHQTNLDLSPSAR